MAAKIERRHFLIGAGALAMSACASNGPAAGRLGHVVVGNGPEKVLVLHEWLGDHSNYDGVVPHLSTDKATYVFADLRGYGLSREMGGTYTLAEVVADCLALMDSLGVSRFQVVGHSMTGMVAQYMALTQPERVAGIVCVCPVPATGFKTDEAGLAKLRLVISDDAAARTAIVARTANRYGEPFLARKLAMIRRADPLAMEGYMRMFASNDFSARASGVGQPVTLLTGAQDLPFYRAASLEPMFRGWYRNLRAAAIADAGHYPMLETPILLASQIERGLFGQALVGA